MGVVEQLVCLSTVKTANGGATGGANGGVPVQCLLTAIGGVPVQCLLTAIGGVPVQEEHHA